MMYELIHRYTPESAASRTGIAIVFSLIGVPASGLGLIGLSGNVLGGIFLLLIGVVCLTIAGQLTRGVVHQANATPEAAPVKNDRGDESVDDPVNTLRQRYATGNITESEFRERLDHLLETENVAQSPSARERLME